MITTTHAQPRLHTAFRGMPLSKSVICPRCSRVLGAARGPRESQLLLSAHRCAAAARQALQPSITVPFS